MVSIQSTIEDVDHPHPSRDSAHEGCVLCGSNRPFDLPDRLLRAARNGTLLIFAGAGISTEVPAVFPSTLYSDIRSEVEEGVEHSFPQLMQAFEQANGRPELVRRIKERLDYVDSFPFLRLIATRFHRELATMPYLSNIITTNWDRYFEEECGAVPMVTDQDYAFYTLPGRKVYKIHGSIEAVSSIVATEEDYTRTLVALRESAFGGTLRHLLATNVVVFVGYSLADPDFRAIYSALTESMHPMRPYGYAVSPFPPHNIDDLHLNLLETDGTYFLHQLKLAVIAGGCYLPDTAFDRLESCHERVVKAHLDLTRDVPVTDNPGVIYCLSYQDGILDALSRIWARKRTGEYSDSHRVESAVYTYERAYEVAVKRERFWDAAYIAGYLSGLSFLLVDERDIEEVPLFFCFTERALNSVADLRRALRGMPRRRDKRPWVEARRIVADLPPGVLVQHSPFLDGVMQHLDENEGEGIEVTSASGPTGTPSGRSSGEPGTSGE